VAGPTGDDPVERRDIEALLAARQELGPTYDAALVESFADRVEQALDEKVGSTVDRRPSPPSGADGASADDLPVRPRRRVDGGRDPDQHHAGA
jgi:hypothetical protein